MKRTADNELPEERLNKIPALGQRFDKVDERCYRRMECAVDEAMKPETQRPIILAIRDRASDNTHGFYDYELAFKPGDRLVALHLLQSLDTMQGKQYEDLVRALYDRNGENDEYLDSDDDGGDDDKNNDDSNDNDDEKTTPKMNKSEKLLARVVGTSTVGEMTEVHDIDKYDALLYWHQCYLNTEDEEKEKDGNSDSDSDDC